MLFLPTELFIAVIENVTSRPSMMGMETTMEAELHSSRRNKLQKGGNANEEDSPDEKGLFLFLS
jgi:hypothetical protein